MESKMYLIDEESKTVEGNDPNQPQSKLLRNGENSLPYSHSNILAEPTQFTHLTIYTMT